MKFNKKYYLVASGKYEKYLEYINSEKNENHNKSEDDENIEITEPKSKENDSFMVNDNSDLKSDLKTDHPPKLSNDLKTEQVPIDTKSSYSQGITFDKAHSSAFQPSSSDLTKDQNINRVIQFPPPGEPRKKKKKKPIENKIIRKVNTVESSKKPLSQIIKKWQSIK